MPSNFDAIFETHGAAMVQSHFGVMATLTRNGVTSTAFGVTYDDRQYEIDDQGSGVYMPTVLREFVVLKSDYKTNGAALTPLVNDRVAIVETGEVYELMPIPVFQFYESMTGDYRWKLRTKKVQ